MLRFTKPIKVCILALLCLNTSQSMAEQNDSIKVIMDGKDITFSEAPVIRNNVTLVQFRPLFEQLNMKVSWNESTSQFEAANKEKTIILQLDNPIAEVNHTEVKLEAAPVIINGSAFVPLRFVGESTDAKVEWDEATRSVKLYTQKAPTQEIVTKPAADTGSEKPLNDETTNEKSKKDTYSVDKITINTGWETDPRYSPRFSSLVVGRNNMAYLLEDRTPRGSPDLNSLVNIMEVNLQNGEVQRRASVDETFKLTYTNSYNKITNAERMYFFPNWLHYDWKSDKLIIGGVSLDDKDKVLSFHERFPKLQLLSYKTAVNSSPLVNDFVTIVDDNETVLFSDFANNDIYLMQKGVEAKRIVHMTLDSGVKLGKTKTEALLTEDAVYIFDSFTCTLYEVNRETGTVKAVYSKPEGYVDGVITHHDKFYVSIRGSIYELDKKGRWSSFIDSKQLVYPEIRLGNFLMFAFDEEENMIVFNGDRSGMLRINR